MELKKLHDGNYELVNGTHYQGEVQISYQKLVELFGPPTLRNYGSSYHAGGEKVRCEWAFTTGREIKDHPWLKCPVPEVVTIYDWKDWREPEDVTEWHIGGHTSDALDILDILGEGEKRYTDRAELEAKLAQEMIKMKRYTVEIERAKSKVVLASSEREAIEMACEDEVDEPGDRLVEVRVLAEEEL